MFKQQVIVIIFACGISMGMHAAVTHSRTHQKRAVPIARVTKTVRRTKKEFDRVLKELNDPSKEALRKKYPLVRLLHRKKIKAYLEQCATYQRCYAQGAADWLRAAQDNAFDDDVASQRAIGDEYAALEEVTKRFLEELKKLRDRHDKKRKLS